jgi:hypothetical protein
MHSMDDDLEVHRFDANNVQISQLNLTNVVDRVDMLAGPEIDLDDDSNNDINFENGIKYFTKRILYLFMLNKFY